MKVIQNVAQLDEEVGRRVSEAMRRTRDEIYSVIRRHIEDYYAERVFDKGRSSEPVMYRRTYQFMNGLMRTEVEVFGKTVSCTVGFADGIGYGNHSILEVLDMINRGYHADPGMNGGGYNAPRAIGAEGHFWDDSIAELGGSAGISALFRRNLEREGLNPA